MPMFSEKNGYTEKPLQFESMTQELRNRIWNIYSCEVYAEEHDIDTRYSEEIMDFFGLCYDNITPANLSRNLSSLHKWFNQVEWYKIYDFVEVYLNFLSNTERKDAQENFNNIFIWENSGYRVIGTRVVPITNDIELESIESSQSTEFDSVNIHIKKATQLFSQRPSPDYEDSIKESISAVEALCCSIAESKDATLNQALTKLEGKGINLHEAFKKSINSLYGYTSDSGGIRHGSIEFKSASSEDAKYMLISCSAFINYLIEKWEKIS